MLVDDMADIRELLRMALIEIEVDVVGEAADGAVGVEVATRCVPDLVVLDVSMPVMDGLTALPLIRAALPTTKIVMFSASDRREWADSARALGADDFVEKGDVSQLLATLQRLAATG